MTAAQTGIDLHSALKNLFFSILKYIGVYQFLRYKNRNTAVVLTYHGVLSGIPNNKFDYENRNFVTIEEFEKQIRFLLKHYRPLKIEDFTGCNKNLQKGFYITFDDGFRNNYLYALPVLKKYGLQGCFFLTTQLIGTREFLWTEQITRLIHRTEKHKLTLNLDIRHQFFLRNRAEKEYASKHIRNYLKRKPLPYVNDMLKEIEEQLDDVYPSMLENDELRYLYLGWDEVRKISNEGQSIGSHTDTHQILSNLSEDESQQELSISKKKIEKETGKPCLAFSYPNGEIFDFSPIHKSQLRQLGYKCAFSQIPSLNDSNRDSYHLHRLNITSTMSLPIFEAATCGFRHKLEPKRNGKLQTAKKKIRIAHLVNYLAPAGKEIGIIKLLNYLDKSLFETYLYVFSGIDYFEEEIYKHLNIIHMNKRDGNDIRLPFKLAASFREIKPDIVHTHSWGTLVEGIIGAKLSRVPIIIHGEHGTFPDSAIHKYIQQFFWKRSDIVLSVSRNLAEKLSRSIRFPLDRMQSILNGVEEDKFFPSEELRELFRNSNSFNSTDFIVGTVGRMSGVKNHAMLIKAAAQLIHRGELVQIFIAGEGTKRAELEKLTRQLDIQKYVHFPGYQKDVNLLLNGMDVFALTSFSEGCSNVIQEAMFTGKPVVATDVGGNSELVRPDFSGYLVESDNADELAQQLLKLKHSAELCKRFGENALSFARKNFTVKAMVEQYQELYLRIYNEKFKSN